MMVVVTVMAVALHLTKTLSGNPVRCQTLSREENDAFIQLILASRSGLVRVRLGHQLQ